MISQLFSSYVLTTKSQSKWSELFQAGTEIKMIARTKATTSKMMLIMLKTVAAFRLAVQQAYLRISLSFIFSFGGQNWTEQVFILLAELHPTNWNAFVKPEKEDSRRCFSFEVQYLCNEWRCFVRVGIHISRGNREMQVVWGTFDLSNMCVIHDVTPSSPRRYNSRHIELITYTYGNGSVCFKKLLSR